MATVVTLQPDPTAGLDTYLDEASPSANYGTNTSLILSGLGGNKYNSILKFDIASASVPAQAGISSATLSIYVWSGAAASHTGTASPLTAAFTEAQATWNNRASGTAWTTAGGDFNATYSVSANLAQTDNNWDSLSVATIVRDWVQATITNHGFHISSNAGGGRQYYSSDYVVDTSLRPKLVFTYTAVPTVTQTTNNGTQAIPTQTDDTLTPTLSGLYQSATDNVDMAHREHEIYDEFGNSVYDSGKTAATAAPGATVSLSVPAGNLEYGKLYKWRWRAWDANGGYSNWSGWGWFWLYNSTAATANYLDGATTITSELVIGPTLLGSQKDKYLHRIDVVLSLATGATCTIATATNESGSYTSAKTLTNTGTDIETQRVPAPINSTDTARAKVFRIKLTMTGGVKIYDIIPVYRVRRR